MRSQGKEGEVSDHQVGEERLDSNTLNKSFSPVTKELRFRRKSRPWRGQKKEQKNTGFDF
tara:strand:- start:2553 stop:2732 length:180 start_codon:yes stop_codon:yes gene_type:complete